MINQLFLHTSKEKDYFRLRNKKLIKSNNNMLMLMEVSMPPCHVDSSRAQKTKSAFQVNKTSINKQSNNEII